MPSTGQSSANDSARATAMPARNAGEVAGPFGHDDQLDVPPRPADLGQYFPQQRQQALGMAARQRSRAAPTAARHPAPVTAEIAAPEVSKASRRKVDQEIARTSTTSGT